MPTVKLPNGQTATFPEAMSPQEIQAAIESDQNFRPGVPNAPVPSELQGKPVAHGFMHGNAPLQQEVDRAAQTEPGWSPWANLGAGMTRLTSSVLAHPLETAKGIAKTGIAAASGNPYQMGETFRPMAEQFAQNPKGEAIAALPQAALAFAGADEANLPKSSGNGFLTRYKSPVVPMAEANAERLMKAILPQEGVTPGNVKAAMNEAPAIRAFAQRTGNPLRTIPEGKVAAQGVADEGLAHYRNQILAPNAEERITIENGASPTLGNTATLGQIEKRISDINDLIRPGATKSRSVGQELTAAEKLGLEGEAKTLRSKLYQNLSQKTGISPEDIQNLREGYGGQYTLKNALESGHYGRLTRAGAASQGEGAGIYPSKTGLIDKAITTLRGGPEAIANRQFRRAISAFEPQAPNYPTPAAPQAKPFGMPPISDEVAKRIGAVGTDSGVQTTPAPVSRPLNGPMAKVQSVLDAENAARTFENEQNQAFHAKRAANQATAGKRLRQGEQ